MTLARSSWTTNFQHQWQNNLVNTDKAVLTTIWYYNKLTVSLYAPYFVLVSLLCRCNITQRWKTSFLNLIQTACLTDFYSALFIAHGYKDRHMYSYLYSVIILTSPYRPPFANRTSRTSRGIIILSWIHTNKALKQSFKNIYIFKISLYIFKIPLNLAVFHVHIFLSWDIKSD